MKHELKAVFPILIFLSFLLAVHCGDVGQGVRKELFGHMPDGKPVDLYTLKNKNGMEAKIIAFGGIVVSLKVPDRNGRLGDVVLGFDNLEDNLNKNRPHFGALIGRYGNRIGGARFALDNVEYILAKNNGENHLHGGLVGYDKVLWHGGIVEAEEGRGVELSYLSKDGEEGYPGNLDVKVIYSLTGDNGLKIRYSATSDKKTVVNLTNHSYFNLRGSGSILDHEMTINADAFTPVDEGLIPTGEIRPLVGTALDFRNPTPIDDRIDADEQQMAYGRGYDHNFVLNKTSEGALTLAARVSEPTTGRVMEVYTTEPGMQFYSGNFLDGSITGKYGVVYERRSGFCLETQHFPDSPNKPQFPSTGLNPGDEYTQTTIYKFSTE